MDAKTEQLNIVGAVSHFFAVNRPFTAMLLAASLLFGALAFFLTPKQYNPEITRPAFAVTLSYAGATPEEAVERVVYELVEKVRGVPGVDEVHTEVRDGAHIQSTVIFDVGYDPTRAKVDLLAQLSQHSYLARGFIEEPHVRVIDPETIPVMQVVLGSERLSLGELRARGTALAHRLASVPDVSDVTVVGGYEDALVVALNPEALARAGHTPRSVIAGLEAGAQRLVQSGYEDSVRRIPLALDARLSTPSEVGALRLGPDTALRDVARVYQGTAGSRSYVLHAGKDGTPREVVMLSVSKVEGSSAPEVTRAVRAALDVAAAGDFTYAVVGDDGATATAEIQGLSMNLITSIIIVGAVLLLFLSTRAALVVLVAIPVTFVVVFGIGYLFGQTVNRITLFALILALGLLVDSAIVVVENIYAHLAQAGSTAVGRVRERIVAAAVDEVGVGLLLSALTSIIVFLPMRYITGMMGPYMGPIAFFVPVALLVSLLVAIVITPFMAALLLRVEGPPRGLRAYAARGMAWLGARYAAAIRTIVTSRTRQRQLLGGALVLFLVSLVLPLAGLVHFQMLPRADRDQLYVYVDLPRDASTEYARTVVDRLVPVLTAHEHVVHVQSFVAEAPIVDFSGMFRGAQARTGAHQATLRVNLTPAAERTQSSTEITSALRSRVVDAQPDLAPYVRYMEEPPGPPVEATFVARVSAPTEEERQQVAQLLLERVRTLEGVVDEYRDDTEPRGALAYRFDHERAALLGVRADDVTHTMSLLSQPYVVGEYRASESGEYAPILVALPSTYTDDPGDVAALFVPSATGPVPLLALLEPTYTLDPPVTRLLEGTPLAYVTAEVEDRSIVYVLLELMKHVVDHGLGDYQVSDWNLFSLELTRADGSRATITWGGEWEMTLENFRDLGLAMAVALLLVYAVLVAQYRSWSKPAYILVTVPLGLIGILWGFLLLDQGFSIYLTATALIGFIALIGIVVNNAILYLEYVEQVEPELGFHEALVAAGAARLRPIVLTSLTTVLGSLTIAGDPVWSGLAWAIVFGLSLSTMLTLVIYPTLLAYGRKEVRT